jgi:hypothetical protein
LKPDRDRQALKKPLRVFLVFFVWAAGVLGAAPGFAAGGDLSQHPYDPPEGQEALRISGRPWRESLPNLVDMAAPDLQTLPPFDLELESHRVSGKKLIRFSNSVLNSGEGTLELRGRLDARQRSIIVSQRLYDPSGGVVERPVEAFVYHPVHNHWHWEGFSIYELWKTGPTGELVERVGASGKVGYCMLDISRVTPETVQNLALASLKPAERAQYGQCGWQIQGISVGWVDTYDSDIPGQVMDVTHLPDGVYALYSIVDPQGLLYEMNKENNSAVVYFSLEGEQLKVIQGEITQYFLRRCLRTAACPSDRSR